MNKKIASRLMVILSASLLAIGILGGCSKTMPPTSSTTLPAVFNFFMQEEPNPLFLTAHFSLLGIGRIEGYPIGNTRTVISTEGKDFPPENLERDVAVFRVGENIIIYGHIIAGTPITAACFKDGESGYTRIDYWGPETFSNEYLPPSQDAIIVGYNPPDFILPTYLKLTVGQYRMKIFAGETLVAVFPFEVAE
jgi:hypothetical protein